MKVEVYRNTCWLGKEHLLLTRFWCEGLPLAIHFEGNYSFESRRLQILVEELWDYSLSDFVGTNGPISSEVQVEIATDLVNCD